MVSIRCKMIVKSALENLGIPYGTLDLGVVDIKRTVTDDERTLLQQTLQASGLELLDNKKAVLVEKIKTLVIEMVHYCDDLPKIKNSEHISQKLGHNYTYLANLFSEATGTTIEHFMIKHKIEKVKELLLYDELTLTQISYRLKYSSVAHLSNQFKKETGLTPSFFKKLKDKKRNNLENV
jgi:AraC-like DNA-binding protein